jgi:transposase
MKKDTDGNNIRCFGWKVHIATDTKSQLPVAVRITPASTSDSAAFMPLIADIDKYHDDIFNTIYYLMDSGYDCQEIYETIHNQYGAQAIIPLNVNAHYLGENSIFGHDKYPPIIH